MTEPNELTPREIAEKYANPTVTGWNGMEDLTPDQVKRLCRAHLAATALPQDDPDALTGCEDDQKMRETLESEISQKWPDGDEPLEGEEINAAKVVADRDTPYESMVRNLLRRALATIERLRADHTALHAETTLIIGNLATALFPKSPKDSAEAEFMLDAMGACQVIRRLLTENERLNESLIKARVAINTAEEAIEEIKKCAWQQVIDHVSAPLVKISEFRFADGQYADILKKIAEEDAEEDAALNAGEAPREPSDILPAADSSRNPG